MKKFCIKLAAFALALLVPVSVFFAVVQSWPRVYGGSQMGCIRTKVRTADEIEGPRILLVGGSNLPYAVSCDAVSEAFGMPCINLGATAYLGMDFYLSLLEDRLRPGDIVIIAPEFAMYRGEHSYTTVWMAVENDWALMADLPLSYWPGMAVNFYNYAKEKNSMLKTHGAPQAGDAEQYTNYGYGPWGDITTPRSLEMTLEYSVGSAVTLNDELISSDLLEDIDRFYAKAEARGAQVVLTWAPYCRQGVIGDEADMAALEQKIRAGCDAPYMGSLADSLMDIEYFYNTNNHLNSAGQAIRTEKLIEDMRAAGIGQ